MIGWKYVCYKFKLHFIKWYIFRIYNNNSEYFHVICAEYEYFLYKCITTFSDRKSESRIMCYINIHLIINTSTFIYKLLYMIVTNYQKKALYNKVFLEHFLRICWCLHAYSLPFQSLKMHFRWCSIIQAIPYFVIDFPDCQI